MKTISIILIIVSAILITIFSYLVKYFGKLNFNQVIYIFNNSSKFKRIISLIIDSIKKMKVVLITSFVIFIMFIIFIDNYLLYLILFFIISLLLISFIFGIFEHLYYSLGKSDIYEKYYINPGDVLLESPASKRNLILIYLDDYNLSNKTFSNTYDSLLTSFASASFIASNTGTPISNRLFKSYSKRKGYLNKIVSLSDVLRKDGYYLEVISNHSLGKEELFYKSHGGYKIIIEEDVLKYFKDELHNFNRPFFVTMFLDSNNIDSFINYIKRQELYKSTTIAIIGSNSYNRILNSIVSPVDENKTATVFDMYPTILASIGYKIEGECLGLGTNLYSDNETIIDIVGKKEFEKQINRKSYYYKNNIM